MLDHSEKPGYVCPCRSTPGCSSKNYTIMPTFANILYDETFKLVLSAPANRPLLIKLVEFFLPGLKIHSLTLDDKEQHGLVLSDKSSIFDLYCTTDKGEQLIVEMQFSSQESFRDRMLYYATFPIRMQMNKRMKELQKQAEEGKPVNKMDYSLSPIYVISILNFAAPEYGLPGRRAHQPVQPPQSRRTGADDRRPPLCLSGIGATAVEANGAA